MRRAGGRDWAVGLAPFYKCSNEHAGPLGGNVTTCHIPEKDSLSVNREFVSQQCPVSWNQKTTNQKKGFFFLRWDGQHWAPVKQRSSHSDANKKPGTHCKATCFRAEKEKFKFVFLKTCLCLHEMCFVVDKPFFFFWKPDKLKAAKSETLSSGSRLTQCSLTWLFRSACRENFTGRTSCWWSSHPSDMAWRTTCRCGRSRGSWGSAPAGCGWPWTGASDTRRKGRSPTRRPPRLRHRQACQVILIRRLCLF